MALNFDKYNEQGVEFLKKVATALETPEDLAYADRLTTSLMAVVRDIITREESLNFIGPLPMYLKAVYVNGWKFSPQPERIGNREEFFNAIRERYPRTTGRPLGDYQSLRKDVKAVFQVLKEYEPEGEVKDVKAQLPQGLADLWEVEEFEYEGQESKAGK
jgi:uncharacterized protein (DUF2267 family)